VLEVTSGGGGSHSGRGIKSILKNKHEVLHVSVNEVKHSGEEEEDEEGEWEDVEEEEDPQQHGRERRHIGVAVITTPVSDRGDLKVETSSKGGEDGMKAEGSNKLSPSTPKKSTKKDVMELKPG